MERTKWTDDLLDERLATVDEKLGHLQSEVTSLRKDMNTGFADLRAEMHAGFESLASDLRSEIRADFAGLRTEMATDRAQVAALSRQMLTLLGGFMIGLLGLLAAVVAQL
jgi:chromosome segregation ATPase